MTEAEILAALDVNDQRLEEKYSRRRTEKPDKIPTDKYWCVSCKQVHDVLPKQQQFAVLKMILGKPEPK